MNLYPTNSTGWLQFAFYALETIVLGMSARVYRLWLVSSHLEFAQSFYIIWITAMAGLLVISIMLKRSTPIYSIIGVLTLIGVFFGVLALPTY